MIRLLVIVLVVFLPVMALAQALPNLNASFEQEKYGAPDSSDGRFLYYHIRHSGILGTSRFDLDPEDSTIDEYTWTSDSLAEDQATALYERLERKLDGEWKGEGFTSGYADSYHLWVSPESSVSLILETPNVSIVKRSRDAYTYVSSDSEAIEDDQFCISGGVNELDSTERTIVRGWKEFLELPPWDVEKYTVWKSQDTTMKYYFAIPYCPDFIADGWTATLRAIVKDPELDAYVLNTHFTPSSPDTTFDESSDQTTYFVKDGDDWKVTSGLPFATRGWQLERVGRINYHYPYGFTFHREQATQALTFIDSLSRLFGVDLPDSIEYYYGLEARNVFALLGVNSANSVEGITYPGPLILSVDTTENMKHELVHAALQSDLRPIVPTEGIAVFFGSDSSEKVQLLQAAAQVLTDAPAATLQEVWSSSTFDQGAALIYATGLLLFEQAYAAGGMKAVVDSYSACTDEEQCEKLFARYLRCSEDKVESQWRAAILKNLASPDLTSSPAPPPDR